MKIVTPEGWMLLKLPRQNNRCSYKVFASWKENNMWWLSSGAPTLDDLSVQGTDILFPQSSGSLYRLPIDGEGITTCYTMEVLIRILAEEGLELAQVKLDCSRIIEY